MIWTNRAIMIENVYCELSVIFAEPDSKWPLYTRAMIMRSLDSEVSEGF